MIRPVFFQAKVVAGRVATVLHGPVDAAERFYALGFSLAQMRQNLSDLNRCHGDWCGSESVEVATDAKR